MMSTNNKNYVNNISGSTFTSGTSSGRRVPRDSQVIIQQNPYGIRVLGRGACSKNKRQFTPASHSGSSTNVFTTRLERRIEAAQNICTRDEVAHSWVNHHQLLLGNWNILNSQRARIGWGSKAISSRYYRVSSTKQRGFGTVDLAGGWKLFFLELIPVFLLKRVWGFFQDPRLSNWVSDWIPLRLWICMLKLKVCWSSKPKGLRSCLSKERCVEGLATRQIVIWFAISIHWGAKTAILAVKKSWEEYVLIGF